MRYHQNSLIRLQVYTRLMLSKREVGSLCESKSVIGNCVENLKVDLQFPAADSSEGA